MTAVALSPKYQVVIPKDVRRQIPIKPGQKFEVIAFQGHIELVPVVPIRKLRGIAKGISTTVERDDHRWWSSTPAGDWSISPTRIVRTCSDQRARGRRDC